MLKKEAHLVDLSRLNAALLGLRLADGSVVGDPFILYGRRFCIIKSTPNGVF